ncbi:ribosomal protein S7 (apicoplast) [Theileria orientalis]|uniref:Ribosomal protein S7 n=1 Tax=Theileria orientalis TaxID=68886 RepID=A0A976SI55_THEOR|nr:ribosomal protein S7 [Theileria orientalis]
MNTVKENKNYIKNLLLRAVLKKGNSVTAKNLILYSSINLSKNIKNFYQLFENMIKNSIFPFKIIKNKNKYEYKYTKNKKSISNFIIHIVNSSRHKNKRISFDFYFKNEINKILENLNNTNSIKKKLTNLCGDVNFTPLTVKKRFDEKEIETIRYNKNKIQIMYNHINFYFYYLNNCVYLNNCKNTKQKEYNNTILTHEIKNLNLV